MAKKNEHTFLLNHGGTGQGQRERSALLPENFKLNDFSVAEWMEFAHKFAANVHYFSVEDDKNTVDNWQSFFIEKNAIENFLKDIENANDLTPHLTLFICFLKLLETTKTRFNGITKRHLDFYYSEILQLDKKAPIADSAHLIFEIAKNISETKIEENTLLEAGKDAHGKRLQYATDTEVVINKTEVTELKSVYHHLQQKPTEDNAIYAAEAVNSLDGKGEKFKEQPQWLPFGYPKHLKSSPTLATPNLGFAIAAPVLQLQEGDRDIQFTFKGSSNFGNFTASQLASVIEVFTTGEKEWLGPFKISTTGNNGFSTTASGATFQLHITIPKSEDAITNYNAEIHGENYKTNQPVFRFLIKTQAPQYKDGYRLYTTLINKKLKYLTIKVAVNDAELVTLRNDLGPIAADKPFYPFSTQPIKNSAFYVNYPELFSKQWSSITLTSFWLNTPEDFKAHYLAYRKNNTNSTLSPKAYHRLLYQEEAVNSYGFKNLSVGNPSNLYVPNNSYFNTNISLIGDKASTVVSSQKSLFTKEEQRFKFDVAINYNTSYASARKGPLKLSLNQSFLHKIFPQVYALALTNTEDTALPNEPYTPLLEKLFLSYKAAQSLDFTSELSSDKNQENIQLFHEHPFGQTKSSKTIVPKYCVGGELYIGLENTQPLQQVQLLFQLLEGTENPLAIPFTGNESIKWAVLSGDSWIELNSSFLLGNTTDNFLKTGLVSVVIPPEATSKHALLPSGKVWLRALSNKNFDAVCKFIDVKAQVVKATFNDAANELSHLQTGLKAGTISKLTERDAHIKSVAQPYGTFGGAPEESNDAYYRRISERLRHKDRAINLWDYEHLILEHFKEVYKVKCLPHTLVNNFEAVGNVAVVVIPDTINQNAYDIFKPRLSTTKRNEIQTYINKLNTFFVTALIINPNYEEIKVTLNAKFNTGYDEFFYTKQLEEDIKKYLSPWAFKETAKLRFGVTFHRSTLIAYLEALEYVDYLDTVVLHHILNEGNTGVEKINVKPSSAISILVSAKTHAITPIQSKCTTDNTLTPRVCLP